MNNRSRQILNAKSNMRSGVVRKWILKNKIREALLESISQVNSLTYDQRVDPAMRNAFSNFASNFVISSMRKEKERV